MDYRIRIKHIIPIVITVIYLAFSLIVFEFGPFKWIIYRPFEFWTLNITYIIALVMGWIIGYRAHIEIDGHSVVRKQDILNLLRFAITVNFVYFIISLFRNMGVNSVDVREIVHMIAYGIKHPKDSYISAQEYAANHARVFAGFPGTCFCLLWNFVAWIITPLGLVYFKSLSIYNKIVMILTLILIAISGLSIGTNMPLFRVLLLVGFVWLLRQCDSVDFASQRKRTVKKTKTIVLFLVLAAGFFAFFLRTMTSRRSAETYNTLSYNVGGYGLNYSSVFFKIVPEKLHVLLISLSSYLTQGYQGMSLSLKIPWKPGFMLGHSQGLIGVGGKYADFVWNNSYQHRLMEFGWHETIRWHSMYLWFANDITYLGVILIMLVVGYVFAYSCKDVYYNKNPYAIIVLYFIITMIIFIPCNNIVFNSRPTGCSFVCALGMWVLSRKIRIKIT